MWWFQPSTANFWLSGRDCLFILLSYGIGCFTAGYYLVYFKACFDIRRQGSGTTGACNVGRALGRAAFVLTFLADFGKGALVVWMAERFLSGPWGVAFCMMAVVAGHIWPVQLRFRGGKGIGPALGSLIVYEPAFIGLVVLLFLPIWLWLRRFTASGLLAFLGAALLSIGARPALYKCVSISVLAILILIAHRK